MIKRGKTVRSDYQRLSLYASIRYGQRRSMRATMPYRPQKPFASLLHTSTPCGWVGGWVVGDLPSTRARAPALDDRRSSSPLFCTEEPPAPVYPFVALRGRMPYSRKLPARVAGGTCDYKFNGSKKVYGGHLNSV